MQKAQTRLTSQGQVSVPAAVRNFLHLIPGSVMVWTQEGDRIVVDTREARYLRRAGATARRKCTKRCFLPIRLRAQRQPRR